MLPAERGEVRQQCAFRWIVNTDSGDHERRPERHDGSRLLTVFNQG